MGSSESTRRVTVERDAESESVGVVRVSERVVRRLQGKKDLPLQSNENLTPEEINKLWRELQSEKAHLEAQRHKLEGLLQQAFEEGRGSVANSEFSENVNTEELGRLKEAYTLKENQLISEIENLKQQNANIDALCEKEFNAAVNEVQEKFRQNHRPAVCSSLQQQVIDCYQQYPQQTLRCSQFVKDFQLCVQKSRLGSLQDAKY
ncbi:MICOS complex subunit MIC19 [Exaiptasia diaphana]|uniref:MICOS complex subunit MIC19 n=1 Tax=Exaiptasia diaphana TaxID=2652724 RepID=A0A913X127_EXADI|nr:MICOS complex subunit MIC19 [Exaiptasia diaphana]KXJ16230.1 MICOS complex subunit MIC19 [Exaiptasia diaphana]